MIKVRPAWPLWKVSDSGGMSWETLLIVSFAFDIRLKSLFESSVGKVGVDWKIASVRGWGEMGSSEFGLVRQV